MDLITTIAGVTLKNPVTVSSGIITRSVHGMKRCIEAGAGAVATKSISFVPSSWSLPRPSCFMLDKYGDPATGKKANGSLLRVAKGILRSAYLRYCTK